MSRTLPEVLSGRKQRRAEERERHGVRLGEDGAIWVQGQRLRLLSDRIPAVSQEAAKNG